MRLLFVIDPPAALNPQKDSSVALMRAAAARGFEVFLAEVPALLAEAGGVFAMASAAQISESENWLNAGKTQKLPGDFFDAILMRKEPPVDGAFAEATILLEKMQAPVFNSPRALREKNEKLAILDFPEWIPPTIVSADIRALADFHSEQGKNGAVLKPLDGMGGRGVFALPANDPNFRAAAELLSEGGRRLIMAQRYLPEAKDGDRRVFLIDGEPAAQMLARLPRGGDHRSNMAAGGKAEARPLGKREESLARALAPELTKAGVLFAGIDVIGGMLTEINITCPTGLQEVQKQTGKNIAAEILTALENRIALENQIA